MGRTLEEKKERRAARRIASTAVCLITLAFGITIAIVLWAKWINFDPYLFDFARAARVYEKLLHGIPFEYSMHYYTLFYMGVYLALMPLYTLFPSVLIIFAVHLISFAIAIPLLYRIAKQVLPGLLLPISVVIAYVLNPSIYFMAIAFLRQEALWMVLFLFTIYFEGKRAYRAALWTAVGACIVRMDSAPAIFLLGLLFVFQKKKMFGIELMKRSVLVMLLMMMGMVIFRFVTGIPPDFQQFHMTTILSSEDASIWAFIGNAVRTAQNLDSYLHFTIVLQFLLLPLLAPLYLLPGLFSAIYILISSESFQSIELVSSLLRPDNPLVPCLHVHDSYMLPILFVAMIHGIRRLHDWVVDLTDLEDRSISLFRNCLAGVLMISFLLLHWFFATPELGPSPLTPSFNRDYYLPTTHSRLAWNVLSRVPKDQPGLMQISFSERAPKHPYLTEIYPETQLRPHIQYILVDLYAFSPNMSKTDLLVKIRKILMRKDFRVDYFEDGILLLLRGDADVRNEKVLAFIQGNWEKLSRNLKRPSQ